ncbi:MAG: glucose PTS transporter subunit IIA [Lachnospiraceae bacterium]|nr:glucose PTS transporter subunit IIA [Lachnospiraceae bacterium]
MDYKKCAAEILAAVGESKNIVSAAHCATRLRLVIADNSKVKKNILENVDGVKGVFESSGQLQIIIGTGTVNKVYDEFISAAGITAATKEEVKQAAAARGNILQRIIKTLGDVFVPIIPAIVAGGLIMGIMEALNFMSNNDIIAIDQSGYLFQIINMLSNAAFTFLPILIGYSAAKVFGGNPYLGAVLAMFLIHPNLQNAYTVSTEGVAQSFSIFGLYNVNMVGYQGHVIPIIMASLILATVEKKLHKIVPEIIDLFVTPLVSLLVAGLLTFTFIGPLFVAIENWVLWFVQKLITIPYGIGSFIMGGIYSTTVVGGVHHMYTVIDMGQIAQYGYTYWLPIASAANVAQGGACLAVALKSKNKKIKSIAAPSSLSCMLGITEPAIFGVNIRFLKPFIFGAIGGAVGACMASIMQLGASATGVTGLFAILLHLHAPLKYIAVIGTAAAVAFLLTWFFGYKDTVEEGSTETTTPPEDKNATAEKFSEKEITIASPLTGRVVALSDVPDETFAAGVLGEGAAIEPSEGKVVAPADGVVSSLFDTYHAIGLTLDNGAEVLIHVGINTVELNGEFYEAHIKDGDRISKGQLLITFDKAAIEEKGYQTITPVIISNTDEYAAVTKTKSDTLNMGEDLIYLKR